jgi:hypothetical protein
MPSTPTGDWTVRSRRSRPRRLPLGPLVPGAGAAWGSPARMRPRRHPTGHQPRCSTRCVGSDRTLSKSVGVRSRAPHTAATPAAGGAAGRALKGLPRYRRPQDAVWLTSLRAVRISANPAAAGRGPARGAMTRVARQTARGSNDEGRFAVGGGGWAPKSALGRRAKRPVVEMPARSTPSIWVKGQRQVGTSF